MKASKAVSTLNKAREVLKESEKLITARQKLIRIADRSEFGWSIVAEYDEDEMADGFDDEKWLYKAELLLEKGLSKPHQIPCSKSVLHALKLNMKCARREGLRDKEKSESH